MKKIAVCGAGIGGLACAVILSAKGYEVEIFEKNRTFGGKMSEYRRDGYRFDTGPSLITMPDVFKDFFREAGKKFEDYAELTELDVSCRYFWSDGTVFNSYGKKERLSAELTDVFGESEKDSFFRYLEYGKLFYELSKDNFLGSEFSIRNYLTMDGIKNLSKFISGRSMNDLSNKFFRNGKLRQLMNRFATYSGSTPYLNPQFFSIIPFVEYNFGSYYVKGGIYKIAESLVSLCQEFNVKFHYGYELEGIKSREDRIVALDFKTTAYGSINTDNFDIIVSNFTNSRELVYKDYFENDDWSCSGFIMLLGVDFQSEDLSHHNVLFSENYENEFLDIFERKIPAEDMTVYISVSNKEEKIDAPPGCDNWFVLVNAPFLNDKFKWDEKTKKSYCSKILDRIDSFNLTDRGSIRDRIKFCEIFTPEDIRQKYNSEFGSIYGLSSNTLYTLLKRPKNKSERYSNLYFTGGNTHPGGGVPLCILSGKIVSDMIIKSSI